MAKPKSEKGKIAFLKKPRRKRGTHSKPRGMKTAISGRHHR